MQKELLSLSPIQIRPGFIELGVKRPANLALVLFRVLVLGGAGTAVLSAQMWG